jgi:hypothetical protein
MAIYPTVRMALWTDVVGRPGADPEGQAALGWALLMHRREQLWLVESDSYEALGRMLVSHLLASRGGPLVVSAYVSPEIEYIDWDPSDA